MSSLSEVVEKHFFVKAIVFVRLEFFKAWNNFKKGELVFLLVLFWQNGTIYKCLTHFHLEKYK